MMSQLTKWEKNGNTFLHESFGSAVLDSGVSGTVYRTKWYEWFLETLTGTQRKKKLLKEWKPLNSVMEVGLGWRINRLLLCRGVRPTINECPGYDTKQSDGEVPVMLELWGMRSTPSMTLLPGPLWPGMVTPERALSMG